MLDLLAGLLLLACGRALGRRSFVVAAPVAAAGVAWVALNGGGILDGAPVTEHQRWVPALDLSLGLRIDAFSLLFVLLVTGVGTIVLLYARRYFSASTPGLHRLAGLLLLFSAAMLGVVTAADLLTLYVAWELTSVTSYLLIGWTDRDARARAAALQALLTTSLGGLAMLGGFVLIGQAAGTYDLVELAASPPTGTSVEVGLVLVLLGAFTKSAQFPFSAWLPGAMVAPTPVSAFLHSATMVKAGVYLIARLAPVFVAVPFWRPLVVTVGLVTMITGGWRALRQFDLKRILAYGTVSQLGFLVVLFGAGTADAALAGILLLLAHALFKACLFLVAGIVDHQAHTRDIRALDGRGDGWLPTKVVAAAAGASMAGLPVLFGFVAKEAAYEAFLGDDVGASAAVLGGLVVGSALTFAYTARFLLGAFTPWQPPTSTSTLQPGSGGAAQPEPVPGADDPPGPHWAFLAPAGLLAAASIVLGVAPALVERPVEQALHALHPDAHHVHLAVWHGPNAALLLSVATVAIGLALVAGARLVQAVEDRSVMPDDGEVVYGGTVAALARVATRVTGIVQPGSLPVYVGVILTTAVVLPGWSLLGAPWPSEVSLVSSPGDVAAAVLLVAGSIGAAVARERISAVLCMGVVGYGMALVFLLQGAPDLALTQMAIDTLVVVAFVLVLKRLPRHFSERATPVGVALRLAVSALVGVFVFAFLLVASGVRVHEPISTAFVDLALPEGGGRNVVNVILVDFRGFDTMGEVTVLVLASVGVYGLARAGRRRHADGIRS